jgi:hypothetical protein
MSRGRRKGWLGFWQLRDRNGIDAIRAVHPNDLDAGTLRIFFNLWLRRAGCCSAVNLE